MSTIIPTLPDFYAIVVVNGPAPSFAVSIAEVPVTGWLYDDSVTPPTMTAITIGGLMQAQYVAHCVSSTTNGSNPESRYIDVKNNIVWESKDAFVSSLQEIYDMARAVEGSVNATS